VKLPVLLLIEKEDNWSTCCGLQYQFWNVASRPRLNMTMSDTLLFSSFSTPIDARGKISAKPFLQIKNSKAMSALGRPGHASRKEFKYNAVCIQSCATDENTSYYVLGRSNSFWVHFW
jgi:hypothetical protein